MENQFLCPHCKSYLNVNEYIVFAIKNKSGQYGVVFLSPELGNYNYVSNPNFVPVTGEISQFYCPACHATLTATGHENLAMIIMQDANKKNYEILFSQKKGEQCTYKIIEESTEVFGTESQIYLDFVNMAYLK